MPQVSRSALVWAIAGAVCASAGNAVAQAAPGDGNLIGEVVVTTQRRSERLRDVPISVVAQTGDQLARAGVSNVKELSFLVPGVKIDQTSNYVQPAIRGISSVVVGPSTDAPVALYTFESRAFLTGQVIPPDPNSL